MVVSFWWRSVIKLLPRYKQYALCQAGRGNTTLFWSDNWSGQPLLLTYPEWYSFAINRDISLSNVLEDPETSRLFHRPLSLQDRWTYSWTTTHYSSMKMYKALTGTNISHSIFKRLWNTSCRLRHKIFFWMLLHDRLKTKNLLQRKSMYLDDYSCVLCSHKAEETLLHLFWDCPFALRCWDFLFHDKQRGILAYDEIALSLSQLPGEIALDIIIMGCWSIWSLRNDNFFRSAAPHINTWKYYLREGLWAAELKAKHNKAERIRNWVAKYLDQA